MVFSLTAGEVIPRSRECARSRFRCLLLRPSADRALRSTAAFVISFLCDPRAGAIAPSGIGSPDPRKPLPQAQGEVLSPCDVPVSEGEPDVFMTFSWGRTRFFS